AKRSAAAGGKEGRIRSTLGKEFLELSLTQAAQQIVGFGVGIAEVRVGRASFDAAVGHVEVEDAIVVEVEESDPEARIGPTGDAGAFWRDEVGEIAIGAIKEQAVRLPGQMCYEKVERAPVEQIGRGNAHSGFAHAQPIDGTTPDHGLIKESAVALV